MTTIHLDALSAFADIVRCGSFRAAAAERAVTPSALSHAMTKLERDLGVRLLRRTTRAVAPTDAGKRLLARAKPALDDIAGALEELNEVRDTPSGRLRITAPRMAAATVLARALPSFARAYPRIELEISVDDGFQDLAANGFDAGIRLGEALQPNMVAVPVSAPVAMAVVAAPAYLEAHPAPVAPEDLAAHACIQLRLLSSGTLYGWEFERGAQKSVVHVGGGLIMDDQELIVRAAIDGLGLAYSALDYVAPHIEQGRLRRVLAGWTPEGAGFCLYYPSRKHLPAALRALIEHLRYSA
ncbi:LysR substrate-binding domain-containing protein [Massilia antarctica]|uniref:LysR substrate-binding domain-containing protein n=1 Tax=Massilia antarctica TaxID=2765360 RepID=UPI0006BB71E7|nr:LysR substrate-binding domain-containing protein [Massilia sp. H27-R4]MCY0913939.1 LysR substrate-binding domain-containing protein [Massilia sp. H27-R4]CUI04325.1 Transcriptional regulator, LysR family [Janthinobacterium sp. CG23_2]CUU28111.1 Transcriptional regulator, LysR family [Janthinobacterium sp. CG23_2]